MIFRPLPLAALFSLVTLVACSGTTLPVAPSGGASTPPSGAAVSFKGDVATLLSANCAGCHGAGQMGAAKMQLFAADGSIDTAVAQRDIGKIIDQTETGKMPRNRTRLTADQVGVLKRWRDAGAPNN